MNKCVCNFFERNKYPLFVFGVALFLWLSLEFHWLLLFNKYVLPYIGFNDNAFISGIIFVLVLAGLFYYLCLKFWHHKYVLSVSTLLFLAFISILCIRYRFLPAEGHQYVFSYLLFSPVSYVDAIEVGIFIIGIWSVLNYGYCCKQKKKFDTIEKQVIDKAITKPEDDKFGFTPAVVTFLEEIDEKSFTTSFNMGLVASWGTGKTSFMNLLEKKIEERDHKKAVKNIKYIFVRFNPRHSLKPLDIQADFFAELCSELKKYNFQFSYLFKDYMKAIGVVDRSNIIQSITLLMAIGDVDRDKKRISHAIARLPKRVIVFIDDLDRLTREECMEVFKLMDCRAAFSNLIFISAYDRDVISKLLDDHSSDDKHPKFHEKYFTLEHHLPTTEYVKIYNYLKLQLTEKEGYDLSIVEAVYHIIKPHLTTIRAVIQFLSNFKDGYNLVRDYVNLKDYLLVSLIKHMYSDEFKKLASMEFLELSTSNNFFHLKSNTLDENTKIQPYDYSKIQSYNILKELFPKIKTGNDFDDMKAKLQYVDYNPSSCSIANVFSFNIYITNQFEDHIGFNTLLKTLSLENFEKIKQQVKEWYNDKGSIQALSLDLTPLYNKDGIGKHWELMYYLVNCQLGKFKDKKQFENYVRIIFYLYYNNEWSNLVVFQRLYWKTSAKYVHAYYNSDAEYKEFLQEQLINHTHYFGILDKIILEILDKEPNQHYPCIFTKDELITIAKGNLQKYITENPPTSTEIMGKYIALLKECIIEKCYKNDDGKCIDRIYDSDACKLVREQIDLAPDMYFDDFVIYEYEQLKCDLIFLQLFGSKEKFDEYITSKEFDHVKMAKRVRNYWSEARLKEDDNYNLNAPNQETINKIMELDA